MLILYNCTGAGTPTYNHDCAEHNSNKVYPPPADQGADFRVKLLHNEKEHVMPNCDGKLYCPYDQFKKNYVPKPSEFDQLCFPVPNYVTPPPNPIVVGTITGSIAIVLGVGIGFLAGWNGKGRDVEKQRKQAYQPIA
jgi:hypothetical protein